MPPVPGWPRYDPTDLTTTAKAATARHAAKFLPVTYSARGTAMLAAPSRVRKPPPRVGESSSVQAFFWGESTMYSFPGRAHATIDWSCGRICNQLQCMYFTVSRSGQVRRCSVRPPSQALVSLVDTWHWCWTGLDHGQLCWCAGFGVLLAVASFIVIRKQEHHIADLEAELCLRSPLSDGAAERSEDGSGHRDQGRNRLPF